MSLVNETPNGANGNGQAPETETVDSKRAFKIRACVDDMKKAESAAVKYQITIGHEFLAIGSSQGKAESARKAFYDAQGLSDCVSWRIVGYCVSIARYAVKNAHEITPDITLTDLRAKAQVWADKHAESVGAVKRGRKPKATADKVKPTADNVVKGDFKPTDKPTETAQPETPPALRTNPTETETTFASNVPDEKPVDLSDMSRMIIVVGDFKCAFLYPTNLACLGSTDIHDKIKSIIESATGQS